MSLGLLLPIGLAALAALLLPVLLHLERRTEPRATPFAALRWLSMQSRPQRRVRLEELWLLLLRLLLVAAVALVFARPVLFGSEGGRAWALVAPGVDVAQARAQFRDPNARWHWLAPGFPEIDGAGSAPSIPSAAQAQAQSKLQDQSSPPPASQPVLSLLREIDASLPAKTALTVFVPAQLDGLDGERPRLGRDIEWRIVPGTAVSARATPAAVAPALVVRHTADRAASVRYLRAAAIAWHAGEAAPAGASRLKPLPQGRDASSGGDHRVDIASFAQPVPASARWLVWLAPGELPAPVRRWVEAGGTAVLDERSVLVDS
ncbi:MAG: BatA domain-containing protein, partial [Arenimonas sp.]